MLQRFPVPVEPPPVPPAVPKGPFPTPQPPGRTLQNLSLPIDILSLHIQGVDQTAEHTPAEDLLVSWQVRNASPHDIRETFTIELRLDDRVIATWVAEGLTRNTFLFVEQVEGLFSGMDLPAGTYEASIVVDPTGRVNESDETDNKVVRSISLVGTRDGPDLPTELRPNLIVGLPKGKSEPIFASSHPDDPLSGKLSVDAPTYVSYTAGNFSIQYVDQPFEVDLYFDGMLIRRGRWANLGSDEPVNVDIDDLRDIIDISPGPHTLKVVVDPLDRIAESDETDNEYEIEFVWGTGEPSPPAEPVTLEPPARVPLTRANLMPFRPFGWDSGITASVYVASPLATAGKDGWLETGKTTRIDFSFTNASRFSLPLTNQLRADILVDGQFVKRRNFTSGSSNVGLIWKDHITLPADSLEPGEHVVRIVLDPDGLFRELDETDNVFERTFTWHDGPEPATEPFEMSDEEIRAALAPIFEGMRRELRPASVPVAGARDWTPEVIAAGRAAYFLLTGRDVNEEGYALHFLPTARFRDESTATCMSEWITMTVSDYEEAFGFCSGVRGEIGFKTRSNGQIHIFVDLGLSPIEALGTYLHELGHGLQDLRNPDQTELPFSMNARGLFEAQAQIFEAAAWRAIEEYMGMELGEFPDVAPARDQFEFVFDLRRERGTEHDIGYRLLWTQALSDPQDLGLADQLRTDGKLDSASAWVLFNQLVDLLDDDVEEWTTDLLTMTDLMDEFEQIALQRLVADLPPERTAHSGLQDAVWTAP